MNEFLSLEQQKPSAAVLALLEAALAAGHYWSDQSLPAALMEDLEQALGQTVLAAAIEQLVSLGILERRGTEKTAALRLRPSLDSVAQLFLQEQRGKVSFGQAGHSFSDFVDILLDYLGDKIEDLYILGRGRDYCLLRYAGDCYRIQLAMSPFWLPLWTECDEEEERYCIALGPFSDWGWELLYPYFDVECFRERLALYDCQRREKMSLCKASLPVWLDWCYRDRYDSRVRIPNDFCEALHAMGRMQFNDEY